MISKYEEESRGMKESYRSACIFSFPRWYTSLVILSSKVGAQETILHVFRDAGARAAPPTKAGSNNQKFGIRSDN